MNNITLTGKILAKPKLKSVGETQLAEGFIEFDVPYSNGRVETITAVVWGKNAVSFSELLGDTLIYADGRVEMEKRNIEGVNITIPKLVISEFQLNSAKIVINKVYLVGRLGQDPELKFLESGKCIASSTLAVSRRSKNKDTDWFNLKVWDKTAEIFKNYAQKGSQVGIVGRLDFEKWKDKTSGDDRSRCIIVFTELDLLGSKADNASNVTSSYQPKNDLIPF